MKHFVISFFLLIALDACAPDIVKEAQPVDIPVSVPCKAPIIPVPQWATNAITSKSTMFEQAKSLAAVNEQRKSYETSLVAANAACQ